MAQTKKNIKLTTTIHKMDWHNMTTYILSNEAGTVTLELYKEPVGVYEVGAFICNLWVKKRYRRQGVATELLATVERIAVENGYDATFLVWNGEDSLRAIQSWYNDQGYNSIACDANGGELRVKRFR